LLQLSQSSLQNVGTLPEDEFASRLVRLVPSMDRATRVALLHALFPVPSVSNEEPTAPLVAQAIARARAEGSLAARAHEFLLRRPLLLQRLLRTPPTASRAFAGLEAAAWVAAIAVACTTGARWLAAPQVPAPHRAPHDLLATQAVPLPPPIDPVPALRQKPPLAQAERSLAGPGARSTTAHARAAVASLPRSGATPFHNVDFSGYFKRATHQPRSVALQPRPTPAPSPTAQPRPRVHSIFGPLFGPHAP